MLYFEGVLDLIYFFLYNVLSIMVEVFMQKKVRDVFNNEIFSIPNYQRDYAWRKKNLEDLWENLLEAERATSDIMGHFLGTGE